MDANVKETREPPDVLPEKQVSVIQDPGLDLSGVENLLSSAAVRAKDLGLEFLLSYHDDGVIWGRFDQEPDTWSLSSDASSVSPVFRLKTLQECRFFGSSAELHIWRGPQGLAASGLQEGSGQPAEYFDRTVLLWGDQAKPLDNGFTLMSEGRQGLQHAAPLKDARPRLAICVRHYLGYDAHYSAYVRWSRLVGLEDQVE